MVSLFFMTLVGTPFSWRKLEGGFVYGWIGYQLDLDKLALGISQERAAWLVSWIRNALKLEAVLVRDLVGVVGRLSFATGPLVRIRPCLAHILLHMGLSRSAR